jgi:hypothetical protein
MNWSLGLFYAGLASVVGLVIWVAIIIVKKYDVFSFMPHADAYGIIKLKNGDTVLKKGRRTKEIDSSNKFVTSNWLHFPGVSGVYLALPGTHDSNYRKAPCFMYVEGDFKPKKYSIDGQLKDAVSAEVANISVRVELYTQLAREMAKEWNIPPWVFIVGAIVFVIIIVVIIAVVKSKGARAPVVQGVV